MEPDRLFHIYNRGNNSQTIFYQKGDYITFLGKIRKHLNPHFDILAYCLMPNHFHLMVHSKEAMDISRYKQDLRMMLSSYTRKINFRTGRTGSLFQQNSKAKPLEVDDYAFTCFHYIHQNPLRAQLVTKMEDWEFGSYRDYAGFRNGTLCNKEMAYQLLDIPKSREAFIEQSKMVIDPSKAKSFFL
ncbi:MULTISPECIES: transposase [unclassified Imperialibacter]|uniref:transposase n=1 Tax=unclassified Imperialibacter TaxID=2629706 RepID=UPI00125BD6F8|nr:MULTISPECIES: transposase [unclassified Imperialibacter]CAD5252104.1 transposase [Imperialibacter sp. 75]CAD5298190.1 transposase [Imperialibacter sp. 89]VVT13444.1 transposase [Imperialibacter sp. EC-SDR9]